MTDKLKIHLDTNAAQLGTSIVRFDDPEQTEFLHIITRKPRLSATRSKLMNGLYGRISHHYSPKNLAWLAGACTEKLRPLGFVVEQSWGNGYRLTELSS